MAHLLLIDDDLALPPEQVRQAFPVPAHTVAVACTGAEGLEHVRARPPDVVLLDLRLPDQSGLDVYRQIRAIDRRIPVIFVTVARTAEAAIEAMKEGAYDYLFKPLDPHHLRQVVSCLAGIVTWSSRFAVGLCDAESRGHALLGQLGKPGERRGLPAGAP